MALRSAQVEIDSPCPVTLPRELSDGRYRSWKCNHCDTAVHVLSSMTEHVAREFLKAHEGESMCLTYLAGPDGAIRFQPERAPASVVPAARLTRRRGAAGVGLAAALAACTPTGSPTPTPVEDTVVAVPTEAEPCADRVPMSALVANAASKAKQHEAERRKVEAVATEIVEAGAPIEDLEAVPMPGGMMAVPPPIPPPAVLRRGRRVGRPRK